MNKAITTLKLTAPFLVGLFFFAISTDAFACTSPTGVAGEWRLNGSSLIVCNGSSWRTISGTSKGGSCTSGTMQYVSSQLRICRGSTWYHVTRESLAVPGTQHPGPACPGQAGEFYYDPSHRSGT
ncbi:MAG: hypothetical protein MJK18_11715, partial [Bdellovibrionales bacterium]|nr:hypothetical protein [Bdellovibrionales bacterium]